MFDSHILNPQGRHIVNEFKTKFAKACKEALELIPEGREKAIFITKMEEGVFFATKGIASHEENHEEKIVYGEQNG